MERMKSRGGDKELSEWGCFCHAVCALVPPHLMILAFVISDISKDMTCAFTTSLISIWEIHSSIILVSYFLYRNRQVPQNLVFFATKFNRNRNLRHVEFITFLPPSYVSLQACATPTSSVTAARSMASWGCVGSARCASTMTCAPSVTWTISTTWAMLLSATRRRTPSREYCTVSFPITIDLHLNYNDGAFRYVSVQLTCSVQINFRS